MKKCLYFASYHYKWSKIFRKGNGVGNCIIECPPIDSYERIRETEHFIKDSEPEFTSVVLLNFIKLRDIEEEE